MLILSGNISQLEEYEPDIIILTDIKGYNFEVPYLFYYDGSKISIYFYENLKYTVENKTDVKIESKIIRLLINSEIGVAENYTKLPPDLFICFEKTNYPSKFFYRKAQMWIGAQISNSTVLGHIIYNGTVNRMLFSPKTNENDGILFEGTTHLVLQDDIFSKT